MWDKIVYDWIFPASDILSSIIGILLCVTFLIMSRYGHEISKKFCYTIAILALFNFIFFLTRDYLIETIGKNVPVALSWLGVAILFSANAILYTRINAKQTNTERNPQSIWGIFILTILY